MHQPTMAAAVVSWLPWCHSTSTDAYNNQIRPSTFISVWRGHTFQLEGHIKCSITYIHTWLNTTVYVGIKQNQQEKNTKTKLATLLLGPPPSQQPPPPWCFHHDSYSPLLLFAPAATPPRSVAKLATSASSNPQLVFPTINTKQAYRPTTVIWMEGKPPTFWLSPIWTPLTNNQCTFSYKPNQAFTR